MKRIQENAVYKDLLKKMVIVSGPRQVGKTTLSKNIAKKFTDFDYLNYDSSKDRLIFLKEEWSRNNELIIFDEIHKHENWKSILKGVYDTEGLKTKMLITGSARVDFLRKSGDSLAGRYFHHRLYPLSVAELKNTIPHREVFESLLKFGGFPEPFLSASETDSKRWRKNYIDRIIREEVIDLTEVKNINKMIILFELLRSMVGSPISMSSLARDIQVSVDTIKNWLQILEGLYLIFKITPYHRNISRSILKEPKYYFYDTGMVIGDEGILFENLTAVSLLKNLHYREDTEGIETRLHYLRTKDKKEVDFAIIEDSKITQLIECKNKDNSLHKPLLFFNDKIESNPELIQLVNHLPKEKTINKVNIFKADKWLSNLKL